MGKNEESNLPEVMSKFFSKNETGLVHLDLSYNYFNHSHSKIIAQGLSKNKIICGFHFEGNAGYVDSQGFLIVDQEKTSSECILKLKSYKIRGN